MEKTSTKKKRYVKGSAKEVTFASGGTLINLDLKLEDLQTLKVSDKGYIKLTLSKLNGKDQYGNDFSIYENDYTPKAKGEAEQPKKGSPAKASLDVPPWAR